MSSEQTGAHRPHTFQELSEQECWSLMEGVHVGRVAFESPDGLQVLPVNHVVHDGSVYFRTSPYASIAMRLRVDDRASFQADEHDEYLRAGWSVLVVGTAEMVDVHTALDTLPALEHPDPWAAGNRTVLVRIRPHRVTGRRVLPG